jgi:hypothetical protein
MDQKIEPLSPEDIAHVEKQRGWVRDHYEPHAQQQYETVEGKLRLLHAILTNKWVEPAETWKLQSLGVTLGDALAQKMGLSWVTVEDEDGRCPALSVSGTTLIVFPLTMISKRVERGETVNVRDLFAWACNKIEDLKLEFKIKIH